MVKACKQCGKNFEVLERDLDFYEKVSPVFGRRKFLVPPPMNCSECRSIGRMVFRNQSSLYKRKCDKTGKNIISMYKENAPFPVYDHEEWLKDDWDAKTYGRDFDFSRSFFEQFKELRDTVPHMSLVFLDNINCDYCNVVGHSKNCYLIYGSINCEDCYYGVPYNCKECVDSFLLRNSQLCLECTDSDKLYDCYKCQNCSNSSDLMFCFEVSNSRNCFGCAALNHRQYCIFNKQYSREEYEKIINEMDLTDLAQFEDVLRRFDDLKRGIPHRYYVGVNNEHVTGDYIFNSKNCYEVYGVDQCRDVSYAFQLFKINDSMDLTVGECAELCYQLSAFYDRVTRVLFSYFCWGNVYNLIYCGQCTRNVSNCFGCVGLTNSEYCILNKQYSKEEYETIAPKIIEHMRETGEWGEYFPREFSPFDYEETIAAEFFPRGEEEFKNAHFKIIPQEEKMYRRFGVSLPVKSPKLRHLERVSLRNLMKLNNIKCYECGKNLLSTYIENSGFKVFCEKCYLKEVY